MIQVEHDHGLHLPELGLWLDPHDPKDYAFVSHAHADHFARHGRTLCSDVTASLMMRRFKVESAAVQPQPFRAPLIHHGFQLRLLPAGHITGSAMLHVCRLSDGATLLYTGDFKTRPSRTAETVEFLPADLLIMETTFGLPHYVFPNSSDMDAEVLRFVRDVIADGETPVLLGYSLGKAQEALALVHEHGFPVRLHPAVAEMAEACNAVGLELPAQRVFTGPVEPGEVVIAPPNAVRSKLLRGLKAKRVAMLSGWALDPGAIYRYRTDQVIAMSDHADHPGLLECVRRVNPQRVITVHGFTREFARELRALGLDAFSAFGGDQLEFAISTGGSDSARAPTHPRPKSQLADFSDVCARVGATSSRLAKIDILAEFLTGLDRAEDLVHASRWFTGHVFPRGGKRRSLQLGSAGIRRALLSVPGTRPDRYREISRSQNDLARTTRLLLQQVELAPEPMNFEETQEFFESLAAAGSSLTRIEQLGARYARLHPIESDTITRLLTGDLRIGLKEGLVEDAVAAAFSVDPAEVRHAHMLTGDIGQTALLASQARLGEARLNAMVPVKCMLASPLERNPNDDLPKFSALPLPAPWWAEPKFDGIRAQLHKSGADVGLFSRDLRSLDLEFPEVLAAARSLSNDFIFDGELIAHAEGRKLGFADLQKRLGRRVDGADLFDSGAAADVPLRYVIFDLLFCSGDDLLGMPLSERRRKLEQLALPTMFERVEVMHPEDDDGLEEAFKIALQNGQEGLIVKDPESSYTPGRRGKAWLKLKGVMPTLDCVVVAAEQGHGRRSDVLSDYTFAVRDEESGSLRVIGKAYSGLTDLEIEELTQHFKRFVLRKDRRKDRRKYLVEPNLVLEIAFDAIQRSSRHDSGMALRFPRIKAIRRDKTVNEIDTMKTALGLL